MSRTRALTCVRRHAVVLKRKVLLPAGFCLLCAAHLLCHKVGCVDVWLNLLHKCLEALQAAHVHVYTSGRCCLLLCKRDRPGETPRVARIHMQLSRSRLKTRLIACYTIHVHGICCLCSLHRNR